jgi:hypothetical protein
VRTDSLLMCTLVRAGIAVLAVMASSIALAAPATDQPADSGLEMSINSGTQLNTSTLSIGCGYVGGGLYDEDAKVGRDGPHKDLTIVVRGKVLGKPALFRQVSMAEGQVIDAGINRILVEKVLPSDTKRSSVILRIWPRTPGS